MQNGGGGLGLTAAILGLSRMTVCLAMPSDAD